MRTWRGGLPLCHSVSQSALCSSSFSSSSASLRPTRVVVVTGALRFACSGLTLTCTHAPLIDDAEHTHATCTCSSSALTTARRFQRSVSNRPRSSTWQEKKQRYDRLKEEQDEAARAAARRARWTGDGSKTSKTSSGGRGGGSSAAKSSARDWCTDGSVPSASSSSSIASSAAWRRRGGRGLSWEADAAAEGQREEEEEEEARNYAGRLQEGRDGSGAKRGAGGGPFAFLRRLRGSRQPLNPLYKLKGSGARTGRAEDRRVNSRMLNAIEDLHGRAKKRSAQVDVQLSEEQKNEIVLRYTDAKWYGPLYRPFRNLTTRRLRAIRYVALGITFLCICVIIALSVGTYYYETKAIALLSEEDRMDYLYIVYNMRYSDIYRLADETIKIEDPLWVMPPEARYHEIIEAARRKGWVNTDWDTQLRATHPQTAFMEGDYIHLFYWFAMDFGSFVTGSSSFFNPNLAESLRDKVKQRQQEELSGVPPQQGPTELPPPEQRTTRKRFF